MTPVATTALSMTYVLPIALLALYLTGRFHQRRRWLLIMVLTALPAFYVGHYLLLEEIQGWPSSSDLPDQFRLLGFEIDEPGAGAAEDGEILLWVRAADRHAPRVHRIAYSRDLHQVLVAAGKRLSERRGQTGIRSQGPTADTARPTNEAQARIRFEDTGGTALPAKE